MAALTVVQVQEYRRMLQGVPTDAVDVFVGWIEVTGPPLAWLTPMNAAGVHTTLTAVANMPVVLV